MPRLAAQWQCICAHRRWLRVVKFAFDGGQSKSQVREASDFIHSLVARIARLPIQSVVSMVLCPLIIHRGSTIVSPCNGMPVYRMVVTQPTLILFAVLIKVTIRGIEFSPGLASFPCVRARSPPSAAYRCINLARGCDAGFLLARLLGNILGTVNRVCESVCAINSAKLRSALTLRANRASAAWRPGAGSDRSSGPRSSLSLHCIWWLFQWFFTELSVRPGRSFAMSTHLFPYFFCASIRT